MRTINVKANLAIILFTGLITITQTATGQTNDSVFTLNACIKLSFTNNSQLKQAQLETEKGRYQYKEALSNGFPQINGIASIDDYFNIPVTMVSGDIFGQPSAMLPVQLGTKYNANGGIQAGQMIYSAAYFTSLQLFRKSCQINDLNLEKGKEELAYNVARLYIIIQLSNLRLALIDSNLIAFQKVYEYSKQHYTNGFITKIDLDRVLVSISNLEAEKENLISERNQQLNMLKYLIGIEQRQPVTLTEDSIIQSIQTAQLDSSFSNNTDMLIFEQKKELAKLNLKLSRSEYLPSLAGYAVYSYNAQREQFDLFDNDDYWYKTSYVGIKLNVPIFEGGRKKSKINQNKIELEQTITAQKDLKNELYTNYLNALQKLNSSETIALKLNKNTILAENIFRATNDQYRQGLKSLTDVLNAQSEYNVSRLNWLQILLQIRLSELEIIKINGGIRSLYF
ncbi:MAG: TolC family protein [Lentimicrobiaceae bacterium]|nr:TolC family protein [Lentimicrobiaceae bacterium]